MLRPKLLGIARAHRQPPSYAIDHLVRENGHEVLRLPPYHPDFNAIEIVWSQLKTFIRQKNTTFRLVYVGWYMSAAVIVFASSTDPDQPSYLHDLIRIPTV